jgi:calcium-dependent protein kinase
MLGLNYLHL